MMGFHVSLWFRRSDARDARVEGDGIAIFVRKAQRGCDALEVDQIPPPPPSLISALNAPPVDE